MKSDSTGRSPRPASEPLDPTDVARLTTSEAPRAKAEHDSVIGFGPYRFDRDRRLLLDRGNPVRLGARALAILVALTETPGRLVSKEELFGRAWPGLTVEETNLKVQISGLRKVLGDYGSLIKAEASLGYRFVGGGEAGPATELRRFRPPRTLTTPLGREEAVRDIVGLLDKNSLVTILGPGGIGKTMVALTVANEVAEKFVDGACFVDLGRIASNDSVDAATADALEASVEGAPTPEQVLLALQGRQLLLILDSCEHLTDQVAMLAERILRASQGIRILVTSRESLRVGGELIWRLGPLPTPPPSVSASAENIREYASVELFTRTAAESSADFTCNDESAEAIAEVCRRLDGIPLAIELAGSMAGVLGIDEIRSSLDQRFSLLKIGRRSVSPRQRSLIATIDWSYALLPGDEQAVLRRLARFASAFTLDAAVMVAGDDKVDAMTVREAVVALANKSFLSVDHQVSPPEYRLLETMRAYATQAQAPPQEAEQASRRHARYFLEHFESKDWEQYNPAAERAKLRGSLEEVRIALDWAFAFEPELGVRLSLAAERLWLELASLAQGVHYLGLALRQVEAGSSEDSLLNARVLVSFAATQAYILTPGQDDTVLYERAWRAAQSTRDEFLELRALYALIHNLLRRRLPLSFYLDEFTRVAALSDDPAVQRLPLVLSAYRDVEESEILSCSQKLEEFITNCPYFSRMYTLYFGHGVVVMCEVTFALIQYWRGYCDQARSMLGLLVEDAEDRANSTTLCFVLVHGAIRCEIASGDTHRAEEYLRKLEEIASLYRPWQAFVDVYRALLLWRQGQNRAVAERIMSRTLEQEVILRKQAGLYPVLLFELAEMRHSLNDLQGAEMALREAMTYRIGDEDARMVGRHDHLLAKTRLSRGRTGDLEEARLLLEGAVSLFRQKSLYLFEADATVSLAELEIAAGNPAKARSAIVRLLANRDDRSGIPSLARAQSILDSMPEGDATQSNQSRGHASLKGRPASHTCPN